MALAQLRRAAQNARKPDEHRPSGIVFKFAVREDL
jgi:hypothetical protein